MSWTNADGLYIKFGREEGEAGTAGEYNMRGPRHMTEVAIDLSDLVTTGYTILDQHTVLPKGAQIEQVSVIVTEACASADTANLNLGLIKLDRSTELDYDGLLAVADAFNPGAVGVTVDYVVGTTEAGALIGTKLAYSGYLVAASETANFSGGEITVRIYWTKPLDPA